MKDLRCHTLALSFPVCKICPVDTLLHYFYIAKLEQIGFTIGGGGTAPLTETCLGRAQQLPSILPHFLRPFSPWNWTLSRVENSSLSNSV